MRILDIYVVFHGVAIIASCDYVSLRMVRTVALALKVTSRYAMV